MKELLLQFGFLGLRAALVEDGELTEFIAEPPVPEEVRFGDIFRARVTTLLPPLRAALVDLGDGRTALLQSPRFPVCQTLSIELGKGNPARFAARYVEVALKEGLQLIVQVRRLPHEQKAALVSPRIRVEDFFLALRPGTREFQWPKQCSAKWQERIFALLAPFAERLGGFVVERRGLQATDGELLQEANRLEDTWRTIAEAILAANRPGLVYRERDPIAYLLRESADVELDSILLDAPEFEETVRRCWTSLAPEHPARVRVAVDSPDLFTSRRVDEQLRVALQPEVPLPHGGLVRFEFTTAGTLVDVDTACAHSLRSFRTPKTTQVNMEAARVVARQVRLRALGGKILVDFIDPGTAELRKRLGSQVVTMFYQDRFVDAVHMHPGCTLVDVHRRRRRLPLADQFLAPCRACGSPHQTWSVSARARDLLQRAWAQYKLLSEGQKLRIEGPPGVVHHLQRIEPELLQKFARVSGIPVEVEPAPSEEPRISFIMRERPVTSRRHGPK